MTAPFDPVSWVCEFEAVGGEVSLTPAGRFCTSRHLVGITTKQLERSWALQMELSHDQSKLAAVWLLMQRQRAA
jgi:hypothetical protein